MSVRFIPGFVVRTAVLWVLLHTVVLAVGGGAGAILDEPVPTAYLLSFRPFAMLLAVAATVVLVLVDVAALHEQAFQANLGNDRRSIVATAFVTALGLEMMATVLVPIALA